MIIPNQLTKFQDPSSNSFRYIAEKFKMPKFQKAITLEKNNWIFFLTFMWKPTHHLLSSDQVASP